ncbi:MAG: fibronectin type III-like domain-contianing protein, partial [Thermofilaceae archaeon]
TVEGDSARVSFEVLNTGKYPGKEAAQVYVKAPKGRIDKPFQELKGFRKTKLLNPNEVETVEIIIGIKSLASFDGTEWIVEKGDYEVRVGSSSRDIRLTGVFNIDKDIRFKP